MDVHAKAVYLVIKVVVLDMIPARQGEIVSIFLLDGNEGVAITQFEASEVAEFTRRPLC